MNGFFFQQSNKSPKQAAGIDQDISDGITRNMNREVSFDEAALLKSSPPKNAFDMKAQGKI